MRKSCVQIVGSLRATVGQVGLFVHQVVFATRALGTNLPVIHVFPGKLTQAFAHVFSRFNSGVLIVVPVIHSTSNKGN